ncbi:hypothetical protein H072_210 [Dactylellina haptotyla CBS 200.50]|uniref:Uncharacterized protein n=1 Tax=Dactylellina haptotyla (strain CBS 200.50) TaxID=1284197 RepID=S8C1T1_DACHA|nr:hypothetical protein H072_210 [Dactylellina haptotyla CBS 200.50]
MPSVQDEYVQDYAVLKQHPPVVPTTPQRASGPAPFCRRSIRANYQFKKQDGSGFLWPATCDDFTSTVIGTTNTLKFVWVWPPELKDMIKDILAEGVIGLPEERRIVEVGKILPEPLESVIRVPRILENGKFGSDFEIWDIQWS